MLLRVAPHAVNTITAEWTLSFGLEVEIVVFCADSGYAMTVANSRLIWHMVPGVRIWQIRYGEWMPLSCPNSHAQAQV